MSANDPKRTFKFEFPDISLCMANWWLRRNRGDTVHDKVTANSPGIPLFCLDSFFQTHIELYFF